MARTGLTPVLHCGRHDLALDRPRIVGIINVTPDSFSDGGLYADTGAAVAHGLQLVAEGADMLDVGGESTRPLAADVTEDDELARVIPVIERLVGQVDVPIAVDTSKPVVMQAAVAAGAGMINDVYALRHEGAVDTAAQLQVPVCLMHMQGEPRSMQSDPHYDDVVAEVHRFLADRVLACAMAGIDRGQIAVDPGFGFGKTLEHNLALLRALDAFEDLGAAVYAGLSRKSMLGAITGHQQADERIVASAAAAVIAVQRGAMLIRVHDVAATVDALAVWAAVHTGDVVPKAQVSAPVWTDED